MTPVQRFPIQPIGHRRGSTHDRLPSGLRDAVTDALVQTEIRLDRHGWDQPPILTGIFFRRVSATKIHVEIDPSLISPITWREPGTVPAAGAVRPADAAHPVDVLLRLAGDLAATPMRDWLRDWLHHDGRRLAGFAFCFEGWQAPIRPGYRHGDLAAAPDSQRTEVRAVTALDLHGGTWQIIRRRGELHPTVSTSSGTTSAGRVLTGLHRLNRLARTC
ncbi:hypothetical protein AB0M46_47435 [Dactylosporangium sp. NPDC051485]|uniref:hypothetical protein n=1 Tax=Dactylosporangium sp. NPDC051485 TaxID=3154846 RepID=UPI00341E6BDA